jgi:hypothetical protein
VAGLAVVVLAGCGSDAFGADMLVGSYTLQSIDAEAVPVVLTEDATTKLILDATMAVTAYSWSIDYASWLITKATNDTTPVNTGRMANGVWSGSDPAALTFSGTAATGGGAFGGPGTFDVTAEVLTLTITGSGLGSVFVFLKN